MCIRDRLCAPPPGNGSQEGTIMVEEKNVDKHFPGLSGADLEVGRMMTGSDGASGSRLDM